MNYINNIRALLKTTCCYSAYKKPTLTPKPLPFASVMKTRTPSTNEKYG